MIRGIKPSFVARWETVEPEESFDVVHENHDDPTDSELLDYEDKYEPEKRSSSYC